MGSLILKHGSCRPEPSWKKCLTERKLCMALQWIENWFKKAGGPKRIISSPGYGDDKANHMQNCEPGVSMSFSYGTIDANYPKPALPYFARSNRPTTTQGYRQTSASRSTIQKPHGNGKISQRQINSGKFHLHQFWTVAPKQIPKSSQCKETHAAHMLHKVENLQQVQQIHQIQEIQKFHGILPRNLRRFQKCTAGQDCTHAAQCTERET